ncbi:hypothetical protein V0288_06040 [Pannus brasiliensis CCIBt3594]|uniref:Photosynthesis system II assembly factor Ycf48/Hcf136-like domain-containing protein n=1 Tax=Pannus brasiliensis CCIBt3594 TaxID=1427578 RepID=A0AAW9QNC9_9CHRO
MKNSRNLLIFSLFGIGIALTANGATVIAVPTTDIPRLEIPSRFTTIRTGRDAKFPIETAREERSTTILQESRLKMLDPDNGWSWGYKEGNFQLQKTRDGGRTWQVVPLPVEPPRFNADSDGGTVAVNFPNRRDGWIGWIDPRKSSLIALATEDGGQRWKTATAPVPDTASIVNGIEFVNPNRGWVVLSSSYGVSGTRKFLLSTENGGKEWKDLTRDNFLPYAGTIVNLKFVNETDGWLTIGDPSSSAVRLWKTTDGGKTWGDRSGSLPIPPEYRAMSAFFVEAPVFSPPADRQGILPVTFYAGNQRHPVLYLTENRGETWIPIPMKRLENALVNGKGSPAFFLNASDGWTLKNGTLYRTGNSGKTWSVIPSRTLSSALKNYPRIEQMQFVNPQVGWLMVSSSDTDRSRLLKTTDGGVTWAIL